MISKFYNFNSIMDELLEDYTFTNPNLWSTKIRQHNDFCYEIPNLEIFYNVWDWLYEHEISEKYIKQKP